MDDWDDVDFRPKRHRPDRPHVFDELRRALSLRKHSHAQEHQRDDGAPLFFPTSKGWRNLAPPTPLETWTKGPLKVLEALTGAPTDSLSEAEAHVQLDLLHGATVGESGLVPTAKAIAAERGRDELEPADLIEAASRARFAGGHLARAAAAMAELLIQSRADDDSPRRQQLVRHVTDLLAELNHGPWPPGVAMGGKRIARLVEALVQLPRDSLTPLTEDAVCSSSTSALALAGDRLGLAVRICLADGGLLHAARGNAAERCGSDSDGLDGVDPADLIAAGARVLLPTHTEAAPKLTAEGVGAAADLLAGWLRDVRMWQDTSRDTAAAPGSSLLLCGGCGFAMPCPWGC